MEIENYNNDVLKELFMLLSNCDERFVNNLPDEILKAICDGASKSNKNYYFDPDKKLSKQNLSDDCKSLISILYYMYGSNDDERKGLLYKWGLNEKGEL